MNSIQKSRYSYTLSRLVSIYDTEILLVSIYDTEILLVSIYDTEILLVSIYDTEILLVSIYDIERECDLLSILVKFPLTNPQSKNQTYITTQLLLFSFASTISTFSTPLFL